MEGSSDASGESYLFIDDFLPYLSSLFEDVGGDSSFSDSASASDEVYAQQLQLQEALMSSSSARSAHALQLQEALSCPPPSLQLQEALMSSYSSSSSRQPEESSSSKSSCLICLDLKPSYQMLVINTCSHQFCTECMQQYLETQIHLRIAVIRCPGVECRGVLEPSSFRPILPEQLFDQWESVLCESTISDSEKFYCPFEACSNMLVDDGDERVTASECPHCWRLFCAQCRVPWHSDMDCKAFQASQNGSVDIDAMAMELAEKKKWMRCPKCLFYVEKADGCKHITCRCKYEFCYSCGSEYTEGHGC